MISFDKYRRLGAYHWEMIQRHYAADFEVFCYG